MKGKLVKRVKQIPLSAYLNRNKAELQTENKSQNLSPQFKVTKEQENNNLEKQGKSNTEIYFINNGIRQNENQSDNYFVKHDF